MCVTVCPDLISLASCCASTSTPRCHVSQVISNADLRASVLSDLGFPVVPFPSDTVTLWRDGEETREGGSERGRDGGVDGRNSWNLPVLAFPPPFDLPISQYQSINVTLCENKPFPRFPLPSLFHFVPSLPFIHLL